MATKSDTVPVQIEIFPSRLLTPETAERVLGEIYKEGGVVRIMIQGPNQPRAVPYGPGKGTPIEENIGQYIELGEQSLELRVKVGRIRLELEGVEYINKVRAVCERVLPFPFEFRRGHFFHGKSTISDYAKYGRDIKDERILGLVDPKAKKERDLAILSDEGGDF